MATIVTISGTSRPDNYTSRALTVVDDALRAGGVTVERFDARDLTLNFPGLPTTEDATRLQQSVGAAVGIVIATPEYHGSFAAMTKLIIENLGFPSRLKGKPVALLGVASGRIGAIKSLEQLRSVCAHTGAFVIPGAMSIAGVRRLFDDDGRCNDADTERHLQGVAHELLRFLEHRIPARDELEALAREGNASWSANV